MSTPTQRHSLNVTRRHSKMPANYTGAKFSDQSWRFAWYVVSFQS